MTAPISSLSLTQCTAAGFLNPFRGFVPFSGGKNDGHLFYSLEFFTVGMSDLMVSESEFDWTGLDAYLAAISLRGRHAVFRLQIDVPGYTSSLPGFLRSGPDPVPMREYKEFGGGSSPDYSHPRLVAAIETLVAAMGKRYDGDRRVAAVQVGVVGHWGEWHTYPHETWMPPRAVQLKVLSAFASAFTTTKLMVAQNELSFWAPGQSSKDFGKFGWHADDFCYKTYLAPPATAMKEHWTVPRLQSTGALGEFQSQMFGGELYPPLQDKVFDGVWADQPFAPAVAATHVSFLINQRAFAADRNAQRVQNTRDASLLLGYSLWLSRISVVEVVPCPDPPKIGLCASLSATVVNAGNAPFYYPIFLVANGRWRAVQSPSSPGGGSTSTCTMYLPVSAAELASCRTTVSFSLVSNSTLPNQTISFANAEAFALNSATPGAINATISLCAGTPSVAPLSSCPTTSSLPGSAPSTNLPRLASSNLKRPNTLSQGEQSAIAVSCILVVIIAVFAFIWHRRRRIKTHPHAENLTTLQKALSLLEEPLDELFALVDDVLDHLGVDDL